MYYLTIAVASSRGNYFQLNVHLLEETIVMCYTLLHKIQRDSLQRAVAVVK